MTSHQPAPPPGAATEGRRAPAAAAVAAWDLRLARAVPFALVCTLIAAAGHTVIGSGDVPLPALVLGFALVCAAGVALGGRERSLGSIAGALGAGQLALHLLFHSACGGFAGTAMAGMAGMGGTAGTHHGGLTLPQVAGRLVCNETGLPLAGDPAQLVRAAGLDPLAYPVSTAAPGGGFLGMTVPMLLGHLAAAVLAGWWLRRGEAALWRLLRLTARAAQECAAPLRTALALVLALLLGPAAEPCARRAPRAGDWRLPAAVSLRHSLLRRGPPGYGFAR
ncbi:hypothetical protein ACIRBX_07225 [Kitasatospora sp. NPDC096147]|uniref:hypothetical protein n=1 Tax=Kitasatospora sp. NPDC096147 TaxID=3364093 RepID=UPI0038291BF5